MGKTTTQVKFSIETVTVSTFKAKCAEEGVSMTSVISKWMKNRQPSKDAKSRICKRSGRKNTVAECIDLLNAVLETEEQYRDLIPEQFTQRYETADHSCGQLAEAIDLLEDAY